MGGSGEERGRVWGVVGKKGGEWGRVWGIVGKKRREWGIVGKNGERVGDSGEERGESGGRKGGEWGILWTKEGDSCTCIDMDKFDPIESIPAPLIPVLGEVGPAYNLVSERQAPQCSGSLLSGISHWGRGISR